MKKILIVITILLLSGCGVQDKSNLVINSDKSLNFSVLKTFDNELIDGTMNEEYGTDKNYTDEERWKFLDTELKKELDKHSSVTAEKYENGEYKGYNFIVKINNIDDVTSDDANFNIDDSLDIANSKIFKKEDGKYISKISFTGIDILEDVNYDLSFSVTLPVEPISHNATSVSEDKKTLTWNLVSPTDKEIKFEFSFLEEQVEDSKNNNSLIIGIAASIIILIIIVLIILKIRKKEEF